MTIKRVIAYCPFPCVFVCAIALCPLHDVMFAYKPQMLIFGFCLSVCVPVFVWCVFLFSLNTDETVRYLVQCGREIACPMNSVWYPVCQKTYFHWHDDMLTLLYQAIPSAIMDVFIASSKYKLLPLCRKIVAMSEVIQFFNHNNFNFANKNLENVLQRYVQCIPIVGQRLDTAIRRIKV